MQKLVDKELFYHDMVIAAAPVFLYLVEFRSFETLPFPWWFVFLRVRGLRCRW
jgi:hypothetical protein